jgi:CBS domain-containing protein
MVRVPTAADIMSSSVFSIHPEEDIYEAIDRLISRHLPGAPVVDGDMNLVGIVTEKDCLRVLSTCAYGELRTGTVADFMSPANLTVSPHMDLFTVAQLFLSCHFVALPVLEGGKLIGRITRRDMLKGIQQFQRRVDRDYEAAAMHLRIAQSPQSIDDFQRLASSINRESLAALLSERHGHMPR